MDLILLSDGLYTLVSVTKEMMEGIEIMQDIDCFDLCDILRLHLTTYHEPPFNAHVMKDGSGDLIGCICKQSTTTTGCPAVEDVGSRDTYPKEGKEGVGYDDEIILPYHNPAILSNRGNWGAGKLDIHTIFINILSTYFL